MSETPKEILEALSALENTSDPFDELAVDQALLRYVKEHEKDNPGLPALFMPERMAFRFCSDFLEKQGGWGLYFGPMSVMKDDNGNWVESPSIKRVTSEIIDYWQHRCDEVTAPLLRARYADLVWEFSQRVTGKRSHVSFAQKAIDSYVAICDRGLYGHKMEGMHKIERALSLALSISDQGRVCAVRDAVIRLEGAIAENDKAGTWAFVFRLLIDNKKVPLSEDQETGIIQRLENRLAANTREDGAPLDPFSAEDAATLLASYYRKRDKTDDVRRVLVAYGKVFQKLAKQANGLVASSWLEKLHKVYLANGLTEEGEEIAVQLQGAGKKAKDEMKTVSAKVEVPKEKVDEFIEFFTDKDLTEGLRRIAYHFVPDIEGARNDVTNLERNHPLLANVSVTLMGEEGQNVARVGATDDDFESRVCSQIGQNIQLMAFWLAIAIDELRKKFKPSTQDLMSFISQSPVLNEARVGIISGGIERYLDGDYLESVHLLVPQIEPYLRRMLELGGGATIKPGRHGGMHLLNLDEILRTGVVAKVFNDDVQRYLQVLLVDQRGLNIRHNLCHGLLPTEAFGRPMADRVLHVVLLLAQVRKSN